MPTRRARLIKAIMAGTIWVLLHVPLDIILMRNERNDIVTFAISIQLLDVVIVGYLIFQVLQYSLNRPWKCPVCDGWGRRFFVPGMPNEKNSQLTKCGTCAGSGVVWERITGGQV